MNILQAIDDPAVFRPWFERGDWGAWRAFLATLFALSLNDDERAAYKACTGRSVPPVEPFSEAALVIGRRGGKSFILALVAVFLACFRDYRPFLQPGERATILVVAADRKQARAIMRYAAGLLENVPMLQPMIERQSTEEIELRRRVAIEVATASFRTVRGRTLAAALLDELAFWRSDETSANPDAEIVAAIRPAMATIPGAMLLMASSPYARRGELWRAFTTHYGKDSRVLVWRAASRVMNPSIPEAFIAEAYERDPASAEAEYGAEFRTDIESFIGIEAIRDCIEEGVRERSPDRWCRYVGFVDPSGGSSDSMTLAVAHREADTAILDAVREVRPPFSPEGVVAEFASLLKAYRCSKVFGDRYAGEWPVEQFRRHGIWFEQSAAPKSDLYRDLLPLINSGAVELLDDARLVHQLASLERRTARGGKDSIDHAPAGHDDVANAVAGALVMAQSTAGRRAGEFRPVMAETRFSVWGTT